MKPTLSLHTQDFSGRIRADLKRLQRDRVLVGIPEDRGGRQRNKRERMKPGSAEEKDATEAAGKINNAQLMFIHTNGSPLRGIPARPVIEPALSVSDNRQRLTILLGKAASAELKGDHESAIRYLNLAGTAGANAARRWFTDPRNGWPANKRATILRKLRKVRGAGRKEIERAKAAGEDLSQFDTPLIDTAQLRRSITYVVRD